MFEKRDLITMGLLSADGVFLQANVRDNHGRMLSVNQCLRAYGARAHTEIPEFVAELVREGISISTDTVLAVATAMEYQWAESSAFPFDPELKTESYDPHRVPMVVRNALVKVFIPYQTLANLRDIMRIYRGEVLREQLQAADKLENMSEQVFADMLRAERQQPVCSRICINPACGRAARTNVEQAATSILKYELLPVVNQPWSGKTFTPHQRCVNCRTLGRTTATSDQPHNGHGRSARRPFRGGSMREKLQAALAAKPPVTPAPEPEPVTEPTSVPTPTSQVVTVPAETLEA
jgi:hypothetical protein